MLTQSESAKQAEKTRSALAVLLADADDDVEITCEKCPENDRCDFAWDVYNTNGDCLAEK